MNHSIWKDGDDLFDNKTEIKSSRLSTNAGIEFIGDPSGGINQLNSLGAKSVEFKKVLYADHMVQLNTQYATLYSQIELGGLVLNGNLFVKGEGQTRGIQTDLLIAQNSEINTLRLNNPIQYVSDKRFKTNIKNIDSKDALNKILKIKGKKFKLNNKKTYGFIAQDVENVIPNVVENNDSFKTMDYMSIMPFLVESIREQQKQIQTLKKVVLKQSEQIKNLQLKLL